MAYFIRYFLRLKDYTIRILEKDGSGLTQDISPNVVKSVHLDMQAENQDITSPIVKTSLSMTFVDAPDLPEAQNMKCGDWEEFYTPDSQKWWVDIFDQESDLIWQGFITPDSYLEELRYRGTVTLVARDGLGLLNEMQFDAQGDTLGMISIYDLISQGWSKVGSSMSLVWGKEKEDAWMQCHLVPAYDTFVNVSAFEDKTWYEAIESVLNSYALCLRYIGDASIAIVSLRYMPMLRELSYKGAMTYETPVFVAGATRELVPAIKEVNETVDYEIKDAPISLSESIQFTGASGMYAFAKKNGGSIVRAVNAPVNPISGGVYGWNNIESNTLFFNPESYEGWDPKLLGIAGNAILFGMDHVETGGTRLIWVDIPIMNSDVELTIEWGNKIALVDNKLTVANFSWIRGECTLSYAIAYDIDGVFRYYNGTAWGTSLSRLTATDKDSITNIPIPLSELPSGGVLRFGIYNLQTDAAFTESYDGLYAVINKMSFKKTTSEAYLKSNRVRTIYNSGNRKVMERQPELGPAYNIVALPSLINNGIFRFNSGYIQTADEWSWSLGGTDQQMAVYNHLCIIPYFAKPNSLIRGTIIRQRNTIDPCITWMWRGRNHIMKSGSFDLISGRINRAELQEYDTYDDLWGRTSSVIPEVDSSTSV